MQKNFLLKLKRKEYRFIAGGDQGLLNLFFQGWRDKPPAFRLPFIYNMTSGAIYSYVAAFKKYGAQVITDVLCLYSV